MAKPLRRSAVTSGVLKELGLGGLGLLFLVWALSLSRCYPQDPSSLGSFYFMVPAMHGSLRISSKKLLGRKKWPRSENTGSVNFSD